MSPVLRACLLIVALAAPSDGIVRAAAAASAAAPAGPATGFAFAEVAGRAAVARGDGHVLPLAGPPSYLLCAADGSIPGEPLAWSFGRARARPARPARVAAPPEVLGSARARILLRSLTLPGWGQATLGRRGSATIFALSEAAVWGSFTAFRVQVAMRQGTSARTARVFAGIDLGGRDEEFRRIVGSFASSAEYNRLVVARDAANLYLSDPDHPDYEGYRAHLEAHSLRGADTWAWGSADEQARYRGQRKDTQRAAQRANTVLALAVMNRIVSALHAARVAGHPGAAARSWNFEMVPVAGADPTAFQLRVNKPF
jgi:hypothetical protein